MIDKHELLGFECLESRHTFAVEDVSFMEFTTTDGRSGHFWYDSHVDPSPYEGVIIDESEQALIGDDLITSGPYTHGTFMGQQLIEGKISVDTEAEFFFGVDEELRTHLSDGKNSRFGMWFSFESFHLRFFSRRHLRWLA